MTFNPNDFLSDKVNSIPPSGIRKFFDIVANSKDVISLGVGEPDFVSPWTIREACVYSLNKGYTMYTSNYGTPELRNEIAKYLYNRFEVQYDPTKEIIVTVGASEAIDIALRALVSDGDEVIIAEPCYVSYQACTVLAGGIPVSMPLSPENDFKPTAEQLKKYITPKTKLVLLSFPNNPTGAIMNREELLDICQVIKDNNLMIISDEIYAELTYDGDHVSIASLPGMKDRTVLVSGMSKAFAMTGWRVGYVACNSSIIEAMIKIHQYASLCAPVMGQMAAVEAFQNGMPYVAEMRQEYDYRRRVLVRRFKEIGLDVVEPKGAFYIFPNVEKLGISCDDFANRLLVEEKVAVVPGNAFGQCGEGFIRCSYATSLTQIEEALNRIDKFVQKIK